MHNLNIDKVKNILSYDKDTGDFIWKLFRGNTAKKGSIAGSVDSRGYLQINISGRLYLAHRLAWLYEYGVVPNGEIDHINHNRIDNRILIYELFQEIAT